MIVKPEEIDDDAAVLLSHEIAREIEEQLEYPGQIKVTVIRETRAIEFASSVADGTAVSMARTTTAAGRRSRSSLGDQARLDGRAWTGRCRGHTSGRTGSRALVADRVETSPRRLDAALGRKHRVRARSRPEDTHLVLACVSSACRREPARREASQQEQSSRSSRWSERRC